MNGFINFFKPEGMSSAYCAGLAKKKFNLPCGHMGTLDPLASGVLPVGVGKASRLFRFLLEKVKIYEAEFTFGSETDTLDRGGSVVKSGGRIPTAAEIEAALPSFVGRIMQIPPKFSAKCVNGTRGYRLARAGEAFELPPKEVEIFSLRAEETARKDTFRFTVACGGGTYIRSLCRDVAEKCGTVATMTKLVRTRSGAFTAENAVPFDEFKESSAPEKYLIPSDAAVDFEKLVLTKVGAARLLNGLYDEYPHSAGLYRVYCEEEFWGVGEIGNDGVLKMLAYVRG